MESPRTTRRSALVPQPKDRRSGQQPHRQSPTPGSKSSFEWRRAAFVVYFLLALAVWEHGVRPVLPREDHMDDPPRRSGPLSCNTVPVPRQLFMTSNDSSPFFMEGLKKANPGWKFRVMGDDAMEAYVAENCPWVLGAYLCLVPKAYQADVFRACALYTEGVR